MFFWCCRPEPSMQIRTRHNKKRVSTPPLLVFIFLTSVLWSGDDRPSSQSTTTTTSNKTITSSTVHRGQPPLVFYEKVVVADSDDQILRYAAFELGPPEGAGDGLNDEQQQQQKRPLTIQRWAELMAHEDYNYSAELALNLSSILKESPFPAFRFETKGCHKANMDEKQFEFVLVNDSYLSSFAASADVSAFAEHFRTNDNENKKSPLPAVVFPNLRNDAVLVVPQPLSVTNNHHAEASDATSSIYGHCGNFVRGAPVSQIAGTWILVARSFLERVQARNEKSVWLSTAGAGIAWLHFRLDDRPKYYHYQPFATKET